jgi:hypothetical protein
VADPVSELDRILTDLKIWMLRTLERIEYRPDSDRSGHPHGYSVCLCPDWELKQKLDVIKEAKDLVTEIGKRIPCA